MIGSLLRRRSGEADDRKPASGERDWRQATAQELVEHVRHEHHDRIRERLPDLVRLAQRVEVVHAARPDCPRGLTEPLQTLHEALPAHLRKEERVLFPQLQMGLTPELEPLIAQMRSEHESHREALRRIDVLTDDLAMPDDACSSWQALVLGLRALRDDLEQSIRLEDEVLYRGLTAARSGGCSASGGGCACAGTAG